LSDRRVFLAIPRKRANSKVVIFINMMTDHELSKSYDMAAGRWRNKIEGLGYAAAYRWVVSQTGPQTHNARVLDAGCGTGDFSRALIEVAGRPKCLTLLDPSAAMVATAVRSLTHFTPELKAVSVSLQTAPLARHDIVLCAHVIEHFADPLVALKHLKSQLAPGGRLLLVVSKPHWCNWIIWLRWRHRMIAPAQMHLHLDAAGLASIWDAGFPAGPPSRSSHAYLVTHQEDPTQ